MILSTQWLSALLADSFATLAYLVSTVESSMYLERTEEFRMDEIESY
jgi:hypothetical protein